VLKLLISRILFALSAAFLLFVLITAPADIGDASLYRSTVVPQYAQAAARQQQLSAPTFSAPSTGIPEPEPEPPGPPPEPGDILALMYHDVTEDPAAASTWRTMTDTLRQNMNDLIALGYRPLSIEDYLSGDYEIGPDYFIVTFDDGYRGNLNLAEPLLGEMGIPACMFLITSHLDRELHLTWAEVRQMQERGIITLYTHTHTHANAQEMSEEAFLADTVLSWERICENLKEPEYKILSYPNGAFTRATMNALHDGGFDLFVVQGEQWWFSEEEDIRILIRINIAFDSDMKEIVDLNRIRTGQIPIEEKLEQIRLAKEAAVAAVREARRAWLENGR